MPSLIDAVSTNDRRKTLEALRGTLAETIDNTESGRDIAALSKRLMEVMAELDALPDPLSEKNPLQRQQERVAKKEDG